MSQENFGSLYKRILVYAPECPLPLAQEFINNAYSRVQSAWAWQALRVDLDKIFPLTYTTGTAQVTAGSLNVVGNGTTWTQAHVGLQFLVGGTAPIYTIETVTDATHLILDRAYGNTTNAAAVYSIQLVYLELPSDYIYIESVRDLANNWRLRTGFSQKQLDVWDAKRNVTGTPYLCAAAPVRVSNNAERLEFWPRVAPGPKTYMIRYQKRPPLLSADTDTPIFPVRGDAIRYGALAELAMWKGTSKVPNVNFDLNTHQLYEGMFQEALQEAIREENEHYQQLVKYEDSEGLPYAPIDASYLQTHDVF